MKIALVGPSPVPFAIGGVENVLWGLCTWINQNTKHSAELIKFPSPENSFWDLINSYYYFSKINLDHFDMVISTKYPAWMVKHDNHTVYMQHRLRGLYDTYHLTGLPTDVPGKDPIIKELLKMMENMKFNSEELIDYLYGMKEKKILGKHIQFPGPLIKKIISYLDDQALKKCRNFYCISETVKKRKEYYPSGIKPTVIYPPPYLEGYFSRNYDFIFTISRLDRPKRLDLIVRAMQYVKSDIKLKIAGTGPDEKHLKGLAGHDKRIEFLGYINNDRLIDLYADALVVPFVPYEEDYGLITIEAFKSQKPVITCLDSGGSNEFVQNGVSGFSIPPDPKAIAIKIDYFFKHKDEAAIMGNNGYKAVKDITWVNTVSKLLAEKSVKYTGNNAVITQRRESSRTTENRNQRKKIIVTSTFPIYPPRGGGQSRAYYLYRHLAKYHDIEIISFAPCDHHGFDKEIAPGLREVRIPKSELHQKKESEFDQKLHLPVGDVTMPLLSQYTQEYGLKLREKLKNTDIVILSHPYLYHELNNNKNYFLVYEAQDVEYDLKAKIFSKNGKFLLEETFKAEKLSCQKSDLIITCSQEDATRLAVIYDLNMEKIEVVPNGVDFNTVNFSNIEQRIERKKTIGVEGEHIILFMGSWHPPNIEACREIFKIARKLPAYKFLLMGSQCQAFTTANIPKNVALLGVVDDKEKNYILSIVDLALNPMNSGSGTNLKMFDYMAAGVAIISTAFGCRGIEIKDGEHLIVSEINKFSTAIEEYSKMDKFKKDEMIKKAYNLTIQKYNWESISKKLNTYIEMLFA